MKMTTPRTVSGKKPHKHKWQPGPVVSGSSWNPATIAIVCRCGAVEIRKVMADVRY